jgi:hypothetical protein
MALLVSRAVVAERREAAERRAVGGGRARKAYGAVPAAAECISMGSRAKFAGFSDD